MLCTQEVLADNANEQITAFFRDVSNVMNSRNDGTIKKFFQYYTIKGAKFNKQSFYVDPEDENKILDEENLSLNINQYITYLNGILVTPNRYAYEYKITDVKPDEKGSSYLVALDIKESYSKNAYSESLHKYLDNIVFTTSSCNYQLVYKNGAVMISGMSCIEKIRKLIVE